MKKYKTKQEYFWTEEFGDEYIERNKGNELLASNISLFSKILSKTNNVKSIIEFGPNIGLNLIAIKQIMPAVDLSAVEINKKAIKHLKNIQGLKVYNESILDFMPDFKRDFVFTKGLLIHINPEYLDQIYKIIYNTSKQYILISEYYNPVPVILDYRGYTRQLFKRDFAGELLDKYPDLKLIDYGFVYHRDPNFPQDDTNWFLLEKKGSIS